MLLKLLYSIKSRYKDWQLNREEVEKKDLPDGSFILRTKKSHLYFYSHLGEGSPILMSREEGERLWNQGK